MAGKARTTIIKRVVDDDDHGHHGGAWKVAYADFMTAMMAFFRLLWILTSADEQKLRGIAEYFTDATQPGGMGVLDGASLGPPGTLTASNGAILARGSELGKEDQTVIAKWEVRDVTPTSENQDNTVGATQGAFANPASGGAAEAFDAAVNRDKSGLRAGAGTAADAADSTDTKHASATHGAQTGGTAEDSHKADDARFEALQTELRQAMQSNPDLRPLMQNVVFERTPQGLRIQVIDQEGKPMFASGSAEMLNATQALMGKLGQSLAQLPNRMVITGHTDSVPFAGRANYDNWDLSTDRANATRRTLLNAGVARARLLSVTGKAYTDPLVAERPDDPSNRRITLLLQYSDMPNPAQGPMPDSATPPALQPDMQDQRLDQGTDVTVLDDRTMETLRSVLR